MWLLTITEKATGPHSEKPAFWSAHPPPPPPSPPPTHTHKHTHTHNLFAVRARRAGAGRQEHLIPPPLISPCPRVRSLSDPPAAIVLVSVAGATVTRMPGRCARCTTLFHRQEIKAPQLMCHLAQVTGTQACLHLIHTLLTQHAAGDKRTQTLLASSTVYVLPRLCADGAEL